MIKSLTFTAPSSRMQILLAVVFGVLASILSYKGFGYSDQLESIPPILRMLDPNYLSRDFALNSNMESPVRKYYAFVVSSLAGSERRLPFVMFLLTLACNVAAAVATLFVAKRVFGERAFVGLTASGLAMCMIFANYGYAGSVWVDYLRPHNLAQSLSMCGLAFLLYSRFVWAATCFAVAILMHPLLGLEAAVVFPCAVLIGALVSRTPFVAIDTPKLAVAAGIVLLPAVFVIWQESGQPRIDMQTWFEIVVNARGRHLYAPTSFALHEHVYAAAALVSLFALRACSGISSKSLAGATVLILTWGLVAFAVAGFVFAEVFPTRLWITAQPLRLLMFVKWLLAIILAGAITAPRSPSSALTQLTYAAASVNPLALGVASAGEWMRMRLRLAPSLVRFVFSPPAVALAVLALLGFLYVPPVAVMLLVSFASIIFLTAVSGGRRWLLMIAIVALLMPVVMSRFDAVFMRLMSGSFEHGTSGDARVIAEYVRLRLPEDAVFVTPPHWGAFRLDARRAIVIDFKTFVVREEAMLEWRERLEALYGPDRDPTAETKFYRMLGDAQLKALSHKYGADYAVLYNETTTLLPVVFTGEDYKIVDLRDTSRR